VEQ
jgi:hypothetical protein